MEKHNEYAVKVLSQISSMFDEDSENYIDQKEFLDGDNATAFIHAIATIVPNVLYKSISSDEIDNLGFNHIANRLIFQFSEKE